MKTPQIELIPLRNAVGSDVSTTLDLLVKIIPPEVEIYMDRPPLNIGLVIDRSGSMRGGKIEYARQAACYAIEQLLPTDRVSVTIYDDRIDTLISSTLATDKAFITSQIKRIQSRGNTALHGGWVQGGVEVSKYLNSQHLNRVILLSDGLANNGETNPDVIASDVKGLAKQGVSTTTMGVGQDYNEDLLEAMASSGDGNYYYIESPEQLPDIFATEMQGIMATIGRNVTIRIEPQGDVEVVDVLNDFEVTRQGEFKLPNLVMGNPFTVVVRLKIPAMSEATDLCYFRLSWDDPEQQERQKLRVGLNLPAVSANQLEEFPFNSEVRKQVALMMSGRGKMEAVKKVDQGEYEAAHQILTKTREEVLAAPESLLMEQEAQSLVDLEQHLQARRMQMYRKSAHYEDRHSRRSYSQSSHGHYYTKKFLIMVSHRIEIVQGDITKQQVDAIVNATNSLLSGQTGVDAAIHQAAGPELAAECRELNSCQMGEAKITLGYNLPARWVIHTVGPGWLGGNNGEVEILGKCYRNSLTLAQQYGIQTIAFSAIGTGVLGFPAHVSAKVALEQVATFLYRDRSIQKVIFVCFTPEIYQSYLHEMP
ncbi:macro domain-containing protein [Dapis sp. BLCC M126]|uniref:macro domain-containing protein n=1 Tax=Dapis sp. BLCC M126 TaxID=3400189 RepID=UPI003CE8D53E